MPDRRTVLAGLALTAFASRSAFAATEPTLASLAASKGLFFGAAASSDDFEADPAYETLMADECAVWTPEWQFNWAEAEFTPGVRSFATADAFVATAKAHGKLLRGHPYLWHEEIPDWVADLDSASDWDTYVAPYLTAKAAHHASDVFQWDVVNEVLEPEDGNAGGFRDTPFYRMRGADYVAEAFEIAAANAPGVKLYLNEYGTYYDADWQETRRTDVLKLLEALLKRSVPVHGMGVQTHLDIRESFVPKQFATFLAEVAAMGLEITITELDVREGDDTRRAPAARFERAADEVRKVLAVALDQPAVKGVVTWSLSDRFSWLRYIRKLTDNHGLPYDEALQPTPMRTALAELLTNAPAR